MSAALSSPPFVASSRDIDAMRVAIGTHSPSVEPTDPPWLRAMCERPASLFVDLVELVLVHGGRAFVLRDGDRFASALVDCEFLSWSKGGLATLDAEVVNRFFAARGGL